MTLHKKLYHLQNNTFTIIVYVSWALYIIAVLQISANAPEYLNILHSFVKVYISLFLIY
jgi:hypothetical protein